MTARTRKLDGLGAVRAMEAALGTQLVVQARLAEAGDPRPAPALGAGVLARAVGQALAGRRVAAVVGGPFDALSSLSDAVAKRLPFVLHRVAGAPDRSGDESAALAAAGAFQLAARSAQDAADLTLVARRLAELSLTPGVLVQDARVASARAAVELYDPSGAAAEFGDPRDRVGSATPAQVALFGAERRRVPRALDPARPTTLGARLDPPAAARARAADAVWFDEPLPDLADHAFADVTLLTGRRLARVRAHRVEDARFVLVACGSLAALAEAVADHLRRTRHMAVGVLEVLMPAPFPSDLVAAWLRGRKAVAVLERGAAPDGADAPLMAAVRAALGLAVENARTRRGQPHPHRRIDACKPDELPELFAAACGLGGHDPRPGDLVALVEHMAGRDAPRRRVVLGVDFARADTHVPKLELWQQQLLDAVPDLRERALPPAPDVDLLPPGALALRVHGVGRATPRGADRALLDDLATLLGLDAHVWPDARPERLGLARTARGLLLEGDTPLLAAPERADAVLVERPHGADVDALLADLVPGGALLFETHAEAPLSWAGLPRRVQRAVRQHALRVASIDTSDAALDDDPDAVNGAAGGAPAPAPSDDAAVRTALRHATLLGACLAVAGARLEAPATTDARIERWAAEAAARSGLDAERLARALAHGLREMQLLPAGSEQGPEQGALPERPAALVDDDTQHPGHAGRFWERAGHLLATGHAPLADPLAAVSCLPGASSRMRSLDGTREQLPELDPERCTGCGACWLQCPDGAWQARAASPEAWLRAGIELAGDRPPLDRLGQLVGPLARQVSRALRGDGSLGLTGALSAAWEALRDKLELDEPQRAVLESQLERLADVLADAPAVVTARLFAEPERALKGSGQLLALGLDTDACKGCELCVEVCADGALSCAPETPARVARHTRAVSVARALPAGEPAGDADDLAALLLQPANAEALRGGDEACAGCGEKTAVRQVLAVLGAERRPRLRAWRAELDELTGALEQRARSLVSGDVDLAAVSRGGAAVALPAEHDVELQTLAASVAELRRLAARVDGELARTAAQVVGSAGCSSRWGAQWPHTPWAVPFVTHGLEHGPAVALGLHDGQLAELADDFAAVRRARALRDDEPVDARPLDWRALDDDELALCPPVLLVGGDGALGEAGLSELDALLASGRPLRVVVLDNQVGADCGGRPGRASFVSGGADDGRAARGELALGALARRQAFVAQTSPAFPEHLHDAVRRGFAGRHPALFVIYAACPLEHGVASRRAVQAARLATTSRAFPLFVHDPDGGPHLSERLSLAGNPEPDADWARTPDGGPLSVAHWAVTEGRFAEHLAPLAPDDAEQAVSLDEWLALPPAERQGRRPWVPGPDGARLGVSPALARLTEERAAHWDLLRELAGRRPAPAVREALGAELSDAFTRRADAEREALQSQLDETRERLPTLVARRLAEGLLRAGSSNQTLGELLRDALGDDAAEPGALAELVAATSTDEASAAEAVDGQAALAPDAAGAGDGAAEAPAGDAADVATADADATDEDDDDEPLVMDPYIESIRCTTCNECTNINKRMFAYNARNQAEVVDPDAGTFAQLVKAAEKCPVSIIHPGTPRNPAEPDLDTWLERAARFR